MVQPKFLTFTGLTAIHAAAVVRPPITLNVNESLLAMNNATLKSDFPDDRFHVGTSIGAGFIPINPTLVNILYFMAEMSYNGHNQLVAAGIWTAPGVPEVTIVTEDAIQAKYLLWGALGGIQYMIKNMRFHEVLLTMKWESEVVGRIWIMPPKSVLNLASSTSIPTLTQRSNLPRPGYNNTEVEAFLADLDVANKTNALDTDVSIGIDSLPGGVSLTRFDVFLVCYAALVHLSLVEPESQMATFISKTPLNNVFIHVFKWGPGLRVWRAIQVMVHLPLAMLSSRQGCREVTFNLKLDLIRVLQGSIKQEDLPPTLF